MPYRTLTNAQISHLKQAYHRHSTVDASAQLWFLTTTFRSSQSVEVADEPIPISPRRCLTYFERFYVCLLPRYINNFERPSKRELQPLTYAYVDDPSSKIEKKFAPLPFHECLLLGQHYDHKSHPELNAHVHAVIVVPGVLTAAFSDAMPTFQSLFENISGGNKTVHAIRIELSDLRRVIRYSSKFLEYPPLNVRDTDLYTVLPKSITEASWNKPRWWLEEEQRAIEATRRMRERKRERRAYK